MADLTFALRNLMGSDLPLPPPRPSITIEIRVSDQAVLAHEIEDEDDSGEIRDDFIGQSFLISYRDARGQQSERRVTVRDLRFKDHVVTMWAFCHERRRPRLFRVDRIAQMVDLHTGEVLDAVDWCRARAREDSTQSALRELRREIAVLVFIARADGDFDPQENAVIVEHVLDRRNYDPRIDSERLAHEIGRMRADSYLFESGVIELARMGEQRLRQFERSMRRLVDADGRLDPAESAIVMNIMELIRDRRDELASR